MAIMIDTITYEHPKKNPKTISSRREGWGCIGYPQKEIFGQMP